MLAIFFPTRYVLVDDLGRQPEILRVLVEAMRRPTVAGVLEQVLDQSREGLAARLRGDVFQVHQLPELPPAVPVSSNEKLGEHLRFGRRGERHVSRARFEEQLVAEGEVRTGRRAAIARRKFELIEVVAWQNIERVEVGVRAGLVKVFHPDLVLPVATLGIATGRWASQKRQPRRSARG